MGNLMSVGFNEEIKYKIYKLDGRAVNKQANQGDVGFKTAHWETRTMSTKTISAGMAINYRELATGNFNNVGVLQEQTLTEMYNKIFYDVETALYNGVKDATGIKNWSEAAGLTSSAVKDAIKIARRWGNVTISGDYSVVSQLNDFAGFKSYAAEINPTHLSEAVMNEIMRTGLLSTYMGTPVVEIPNSYNLLKLNADADFYETYLPEGLLFFLVSGELSPVQVGYKGGLQSASGFDVVTGMEITRFDIEWGTKIIDEYIPMIGIVSDSNFSVDK
jgi:hypothetical protein